MFASFPGLHKVPIQDQEWFPEIILAQPRGPMPRNADKGDRQTDLLGEGPDQLMPVKDLSGRRLADEIGVAHQTGHPQAGTLFDLGNSAGNPLEGVREGPERVDHKVHDIPAMADGVTELPQGPCALLVAPHIQHHRMVGLLHGAHDLGGDGRRVQVLADERGCDHPHALLQHPRRHLAGAEVGGHDVQIDQHHCLRRPSQWAIPWLELEPGCCSLNQGACIVDSGFGLAATKPPGEKDRRKGGTITHGANITPNASETSLASRVSEREGRIRGQRAPTTTPAILPWAK